MFVNSHSISVYFSPAPEWLAILNGVYMFVNSHAISVYFSLSIAASQTCTLHVTILNGVYMFVNSHAISVYFSLVAAPFSVIGTLNGVYMFVNSHAISVYFSLVAAPVLCDWHPQWSVHVCELTCYQCLFLSCCSSRSL